MSGSSRVSISDSVRRMIEDIKEITGQHSDEDIYEMLKDCNMDPNETAQKLLYLDTFHEVKRKRDRRKGRLGTRGGGNQYSSHNSSGGRQPHAREEYYYSNPYGKYSKSSGAVLHKESNKGPAKIGSIPAANGSKSEFNGGSIHELSQLADQNNKSFAKDTSHDGMSKRLPSLRPVTVKQFPNKDPSPTPSSTPTSTSTAATARTQGGSLKPKSSQVGNSVGLYSSATDPVLVPSLNPRNPGSVGIIKRDRGIQRNAAEISGDLVDDSRMNAGQNVTFGQVVTGSVNSSSNTQPIEYEGVESGLAEPSRLQSSTSHHIDAAKSNQETCLVQQDDAPSKDTSEAAVAGSEANHSLTTAQDPISEQSTSEADIKQQKPHTSARKSVIFPNHLRVPEAFKNSLTFGSLESSVGQDNEPSPGDTSIDTDLDIPKESPALPQSGCSDFPDRPPSPPPHVIVNINSSPERPSPLRYDQSKQEMLQPVGGSHNSPIPPTMPDYGLNLIPPVVGSHPMQLEVLKTQVGNSVVPSSSTPSITQPRGIPQSSITVPPPQMFPFLRQTYPPNYIPYNPYFSQLYMPPQNTHRLLSHSGFPHQPSPANMSPTAAAAPAPGVKFPVRPVYKPGTVPSNMSHYGISSGYGLYGTSGMSYGPGPGPGGALPPWTSSNDDIVAGPELKDKNIYSTMK